MFTDEIDNFPDFEIPKKAPESPKHGHRDILNEVLKEHAPQKIKENSGGEDIGTPEFLSDQESETSNSSLSENDSEDDTLDDIKQTSMGDKIEEKRFRPIRKRWEDLKKKNPLFERWKEKFIKK